MTPAPLLELDAVRISYEGAARATPDGVSLDIRAGEVVLVLGPSGCGKSTLALALDGLVPHAIAARLEGSVRVAGADTRDRTVAELSEHVAMVFQDPDAQVVTGTLLDEVAFGPREPLVPAAEVLERAERALKLVGLWDRRADNPDVLSGGGRQRLAIACALASPRPCWCSTSPRPTSTPPGSTRSTPCSASSRTSATTPSCSSSTTSTRPSTSSTGSSCSTPPGALVIDGPVREVLQGRAGELLELGVWLPVSTLAAMRLRDGGGGARPAAAHPRRARGRTRGDRRAPVPRRRRACRRGRGCDPRMPRRPRRPPRSRCADCSVRRGGRRGPVVVHGVDLDVASGDFLAIVGTNGAGKTTLLQAIAGVIPAPAGSVDVLGMDPSRADARDRAPPHRLRLPEPRAPVRRAHGRRRARARPALQGVPEAERHDEVERMLRRFDLSRAARPASVPALGRAEAAALGRHRARRGRAGARARRAHVRPGPRPRRRAARHAPRSSTTRAPPCSSSPTTCSSSPTTRTGSPSCRTAA